MQLCVKWPNVLVSWLELSDLPVDVRKWRKDLKEWLNWLYDGIHRKRVCLVCGKPFMEFDVHHGIVSRQDVRGWPSQRRVLIDTCLNVVPLHHTCHMDHPPTREAVWKVQSEFYGEDIMKAWYYALPWKTGKPPRLF